MKCLNVSAVSTMAISLFVLNVRELVPPSSPLPGQRTFSTALVQKTSMKEAKKGRIFQTSLARYVRFIYSSI